MAAWARAPRSLRPTSLARVLRERVEPPPLSREAPPRPSQESKDGANGPGTRVLDPRGCSLFPASWGMPAPPRAVIKALNSATFSTAVAASEDLDAGPQHALPDAEPPMSDLPPTKVVEQLDRYIVGQADAKRAVAVALRNRWRRRKIEGPMKAEIVPKNILMIGPTGCGKTEIARRLAKLTDAPFVKVEATKFTEVGFHGRDVDQIIRDLLENAIQLQRNKTRARVAAEVEQAVEDKILDLLIGSPTPRDPRMDGASAGSRMLDRLGQRETFRSLYKKGSLDERRLQMDVPGDMPTGGAGGKSASVGSMSSRDMMDMGPGNLMDHYVKQLEKAVRGQRMERRDVSVAEAKEILRALETEKLLSAEAIVKEAIQVTESDGIVFLDEIDKIVSNSDLRHGADASAEGVQRDLLPIIEGSVVSTRHGNVSTEHILFICSGAFHSVKPSDMLAELQGRLPIRVELRALEQRDLFRILTEPETNMIAQQQLLMATEGIDLQFTDAAIDAIAGTAAEVNKTLHNIGARRLHTVLERVVEDISFNGPERAGEKIVIDREDVDKALSDLTKSRDLSQYIL